jgi:hypothetical protein
LSPTAPRIGSFANAAHAEIIYLSCLSGQMSNV